MLEDGEELNKIHFFSATVDRMEKPEVASSQQKFFAQLQRDSHVIMHTGKLVKRHLNDIWVQCSVCKKQLATDVNCPKCGRVVFLRNVERSVEKGVDVQLAITMLVDALNDEYDVALLFSSDADMKPSVMYIIQKTEKEVDYCHFPKPFTGDLVNSCSGTRRMNQALIEAHRIHRE
ncbi:hypothetical protein AUJ68_00010 [Candidatus Woesearchaeota archaeon CG1_02_57_44]|nr:MAG: hypothetical protein AUJ68_00010 [Candidatus Woesearchaeota archaeon CG1_02_57_44]